MWTLTQTINSTQAFIDYNPLTAGTGFEPAASIATMVRNTMLNAPFSWGWNRIEDSSLVTVSSPIQQDYTVNLTNFGWLERATLIPANGKAYQIANIYNTAVLGVSNQQQRPDAISVQSVIYGTSVKFRFMAAPDAAYTVALEYQALPIPFQSFAITSAANAADGQTIYTGVFTASSFVTGQTALIAGFVTPANNGEFTIVASTGTSLTLANPNGVAETNAATAVNETWAPIPDSFIDIFNTLFMAEAYQAVDDARGAQYRQRGALALLSKAEGLTSIQKDDFLAQYLMKDSQALTAQQRTQQGNSARQV